MQLFLQHCCKTGWIPTLRVFPPTSNLFCNKSACSRVWTRVVKRATSPFLPNKLHFFFCPFYLSLRKIPSHWFGRSDMRFSLSEGSQWFSWIVWWSPSQNQERGSARAEWIVSSKGREWSGGARWTGRWTSMINHIPRPSEYFIVIVPASYGIWENFWILIFIPGPGERHLKFFIFELPKASSSKRGLVHNRSVVTLVFSHVNENLLSREKLTEDQGWLRKRGWS